MQKKGYRILAILLCLLFIFSGCAKSEPVAATTTYEPEPFVETEPEIVTVTEEQESIVETESEDIPSDTSIAWIETRSCVKDLDGYEYEILIKVSPWIFSSNESILQSAWNEVGQGNKLPGYSDILFPLSSNNCYLTDWLNDFNYDERSQQGHRFTAYSTKDDFYYAVGQVTVNNITEGWDIEESNPRTIRYSVGVQHSDPHNIYGLYVENSNAYNAMGRIFYSDSYFDTSAGVLVSPNIVKNTWGPVPFVLIAGESFSPNSPDGEYYDYWKDTKLKVGPPVISYSVHTEELENNVGDNTYIGIIDRNGNYYIPDGYDTN